MECVRRADVIIYDNLISPSILNEAKTEAKLLYVGKRANAHFMEQEEINRLIVDEAKKGGAKVVATGRSDFPNQINNVLVFPGVFRGAFDVRASDINEEMKIAASKAIAALISDEELSADNIIPKAFDKRVGPAVAKAVAEAARKNGCCTHLI